MQFKLTYCGVAFGCRNMPCTFWTLLCTNLNIYVYIYR